MKKWLYFFKLKQLRKDLALLKPIFDILNNNTSWFDEKWNKLVSVSKSEPTSDVEIVLLLTYTGTKLNELLNYFSTIEFTKRNKELLFFFTDYVEDLLRYHKKEFDKKYFSQYMFFYNELILGSQRYLNIKNKISEIEGDL